MKRTGMQYYFLRVMALGLLIVSGALFCSCEDVISLDLKNVQPRIVIEGGVYSNQRTAEIRISKTANFGSPSIFPNVSGAFVTISDNAGNMDTLAEQAPGVYVTERSPRIIPGIIGRTYTATVIVDSVIYAATATMPPILPIHTVDLEYHEGGTIGAEDEGYWLHVYFNDPPEIENYCRIKIWKNYVPLDDYYLYRDKFNNGSSIDYNDIYENFVSRDTINVQLLSMDENVYDYFSTLVAAVAGDEGGEPQVAPANPVSNWDNDALGYFGAFAVSSWSLVVP